MNRAWFIIIGIIIIEVIANIRFISRIVHEYKESKRILWKEIIEDVITLLFTISSVVMLWEGL